MTSKTSSFRSHGPSTTTPMRTIGACAAGSITPDELDAIEKNACPGAGSCGGMFTANTMSSAVEAMGLALPASASPAAVDPAALETVIRAMQKAGVDRLICQSTLGVGDSDGNLTFFWRRIMFGWFLRAAFEDPAAEISALNQRITTLEGELEDRAGRVSELESETASLRRATERYANSVPLTWSLGALLVALVAWIVVPLVATVAVMDRRGAL